MIRVVMFDLGMTLIDSANQPFANVKNALTAISGLKTADRETLHSCLVSDFTMAMPMTDAKVTTLFDEYLAILDATGLRPFFEPVTKRVTLSTQAGVSKPNPKIFKKALQRLGISISLKECLFITENAAHIRKARDTLKMKTLQFRSAGSNEYDFEDWADAPGLIANLVAPSQDANIHAALKAHLAAKGIDLLTFEPEDSSGAVKFSGQIWSPISVPGFKSLQEVYVAIPIKGKVTRGEKGKVRSAKPKQPSTEELAEATSFVRSLATHGQIAGQGGKPAMGPTHEIETDKKGNRRLVRKRFTAV